MLVSTFAGEMDALTVTGWPYASAVAEGATVSEVADCVLVSEKEAEVVAPATLAVTV